MLHLDNIWIKDKAVLWLLFGCSAAPPDPVKGGWQASEGAVDWPANYTAFSGDAAACLASWQA